MLLKIPDWVIFAGILFVLPLALFYAMSAFEFGPKLGVKHLGRFTVMLVVVLVPLCLAFSSMPPSRRENVAIVLRLGCAAFFWTLVLAYPIRKARAGKALLDIGRHRRCVCLLIVLGMLVVCLLCSEIASIVRANLQLDELSRAVAFLSIGAYALFAISGRTQITEHGIFYCRHLIRYDRIVAYRWEEGKGSVLTLKLDRNLPLFREVNLLVPPQYRDCIDELLSQNVAL